ncbi:MAG TPA: hypothetical protein VGA34_13440 [Alteraurantiacibacter sp.]
MKFISTKQALARINKLRLQLASETDPATRADLNAEIRRLNRDAGAIEARSTYRAKLADLGRNMMGAY